MPSDASNVISKIANTVKNYPKMSLLITISCGIIAVSYLRLIHNNERTFFKNGSLNLTVNNIASNSITSLKFLPEFNINLPADCPVSINDLAFVKLLYWGFDDKQHVGALIVNKELAQEVLIFLWSFTEINFPSSKCVR